MWRMSWMKTLQRGQLPRVCWSSREQRRQKVWPHGMKAAPLCRTMHTQHTCTSSSSSSSCRSRWPSSSLSSTAPHRDAPPSSPDSSKWLSAQQRMSNARFG
ncbi:hypothetical protein ZWY2020_019423 [Hordeum vulgare]|nr:hypothetical protein ZWY2020_019423 [Hordeum vulgare]